MKQLQLSKRIIISLIVMSALSSAGLASAKDIVIKNDADYAAQRGDASVMDGSGNIRPANSNSNNTVTLGNGNVKTLDLNLDGKKIYGALVTSSASNVALTGNKVVYVGNIYSDKVYGAYAGEATNMDLSGNSVSIDYSSRTDEVCGAFGSDCHGTVTANNNTVTVADKSGASNVTGGQASGASGETVTAAANGNSVTVTNPNDSVSSIFGGYAEVSMGSAAASNNTVVCNNTSIFVKIMGGHAVCETAYGTADASGNTLTLTGTQDAGRYFYVGLAVTGDQAAKATANNNTLNIYDSPNFANTVIYGGLAEQGNILGSISYLKGTGNTINIYTKGLTAQNVGYFNNYNFYLPASTANGDTILTLTGATASYESPLDATTDLTGTAIGVTMGAKAGETVTLQKGDKVTLIHNSNGVTTDSTLTNNIAASQDIAVTYNFVLSSDATNLYATLADSLQLMGNATVTRQAISVNPQVKNILEGRLGSFAFLQKGSDIILQPALLGALARNSSYEGVTALDYGKVEASTGSTVEAKGLSLLVGAGRNLTDQGGAQTRYMPVFLEAGWGTYDADNSFAQLPSVHGSGDTNYYGLGIYGQRENDKGFYYEGSLRVGRVNDNYTSSDLRYHGQDASYDITSTYYGGHVGLGKKFTLSPVSKVNVFGQYIYSHVKGADTDIFLSRYKFDSLTSNRLRLGAIYETELKNSNTFYGGLAWEYEMSGGQEATVNGYDVASPSLKGHTGIVSCGLRLNQDAKGNFNLNLGLEERFGKRHGLTGRVECVFKL